MAFGLMKPKLAVLGTDFAGTVESVGRNVKQFQRGDEVFGGTSEAYAEYVSVPADGAVVPKPANITFEQAGAVAVAAITALQGLRDKGHIQAGQKVLINGASGGVGTFDQDLLPGLNVTFVAKTLQRCDRRHSHGARLLEGDVRRFRHDCPIRWNGHVLGVGLARPAEHLISRLKLLYVSAGRLNRPCKVSAQHCELWFHESECHAPEERPSGQGVPVPRIHGSRANSYQNIVIGDHRPVDVLQLENVGGAELVSDDRPHRARPPLMVMTTFPTFCSVSTYLVASITSSNG